MTKKIQSNKKTYLSSLSENEQKEIGDKVNYELELTYCNNLKKMTVVGAITNALAGFFVIWVLYQQVSHFTLISWYSILILCNGINVAWAIFGYKYAEITPVLLKKWRYGLYFIMIVLCLTWGSMGILFISGNPFYQLFVITFLQVAVLGFSFTSIFDFILAIICITCLLLPTIGYHLYESMRQVATLGHDNFLNLAFSISLFMLGAFVLVVCYIAYKLTISQATLGFLNATLNVKLDDMNKFLEQRVKERTIELEKSLKLVTYQATHDLLTDLPNQRLLLEYLQSAIESANKNEHIFCVIFFSINELEKINNGFGHRVGDQVVKTIAQRFQKKFANNNPSNLDNPNYIVTLSRKDTFVILLDRITKIEEIENKAEILFSILDEPIVTEKHAVKLTASIGITLYPRDGTEIQSLLMNADATMLRAKQCGGNSINMYKAEINADISKQLEMERNLHDAVKNNELILQYQPFIDLKTGQICGMEALIRWHHPTLGFISPIHFIALAEKNGVIVPLGEWVLRTACAQIKIWHERGYNSLKIAVNLSVKQLQQKNILQTITNVAKETNINPKYLELELTETEAFQDDVIPILRQLKDIGFGLSIDDFGTGYSGLTNLKLFTIDKLKIDKTFVQDVVTNIHSRAIVSNIISLARKLQVTVLAEGVETKEQLDFLKEQGCDLVQGYYFSPPISPEDFTKLLESEKQFTI